MLNKAIKHGKEYRKPYAKGKAVDITCRNHGSCLWCSGNRRHNSTIKKISSSEKVLEWRTLPSK